MAFEAKNFVLCSKFNLFKAHCNLWIYVTGDTLEDCLATNYFQPRRNLSNQDSPEVGDVIQLIVENSKLAYLKIIAKTEKPYNITVARTFLENEATLLALITELQLDTAKKATDFVTAITSENLGLTQAEYTELENKIDTAANSGRMITPQGFWYAKMYTETVAPSAEDGTNYADFSQTDGQGNPIIVTYNRVNGAWVQDQTITPPADYDGYVPITSKIWDITEQDGQQGGRILWNHTSKEFTPYPQIISFDSIEITGNSTVEMPQTPTDDNIANVGFVKNTIGGARNIGDIFLTMRTDTGLNGAVECDGNTYQTSDFIGVNSIGNLLAGGKIPYVSLASYAADITAKGWCDKFGWDGVGTTAFKVPTLNAYIWQKLNTPVVGTGKGLGLIGSSTGTWAGRFNGQGNNATDYVILNTFNVDPGTGGGGDWIGGGAIGVVTDPTKSALTTDTTGNISDQRVMVQLAVTATDEAVETCTGVLADVATLKGYDYVVESQLPTAQNNYTWYRKYVDGWVEMGGQTNDSTDGAVTITLPVQLADANYVPLITGLYITNTAQASNNGASKAAGAFADRTTTSFKLWKQGAVPYGWEIKWMVQA